MKTSRNQTSRQSKQYVSNIPRPENKDNLDSRVNEEQDFKGDDITHNEKETKEHHLKEKSKDKND